MARTLQMRSGFPLTYFVKQINKHCTDPNIGTLYVLYFDETIHKCGTSFTAGITTVNIEKAKKLFIFFLKSSSKCSSILGTGTEIQEKPSCRRSQRSIFVHLIWFQHSNIDRCVTCLFQTIKSLWIHSILTPILIVVVTKISVSPSGWNPEINCL